MSSWDGNDEEEDEIIHSQLSLYAILNVSKEASTEEIKRAYRNAAQVFHPDKHTDPMLRDHAKESFAKLQEAYEVLSDPSRREIYDVYGKQGLAAGMEVGQHLKGHAELKKEWEEFRRRRSAQRQEQLTNHKGVYICRINASDLQRARHGQASGPLFKAVVVQNSVEAPIGDHDVVTIQGQAALRNQIGTGNMIMGYRHTPGPDDALEASLVLGQQTAVSGSSTRRLSPYTQATLTTTWTMQDGVGLQLAVTRNLFNNMQGQYNWVLGPPNASGMSLAVTHRGTKHVLGGKLEVGANTVISARVTLVATPTINMRVVARCGLTGVDLEVGANKRWSPQSSGYMGAVVGLQGIALKTRYVRGGQVFECPIMLTQEPGDWRVLVASYTLPPLLYWGAVRYVVRPVAAWRRRYKERQTQAEHAEQISASLAAAMAEQGLVLPVARRKARAEVANGGLVVLEAAYGSLSTYLADQRSARQPQQSALFKRSMTAVPEANTTMLAAEAAGGPASMLAEAARVHTVPSAQGNHTSAATGEQVGPATPAEPDTAALLPEPPVSGSQSPFLYVTAALQYLVVNGRLALHENGSKSNLMGFADMAPGDPKQLYVAYWSGGAVYEVTLSDTEAATLPGAAAATRISDPERCTWLMSRGAAAFGVDFVAAGV